MPEISFVGCETGSREHTFSRRRIPLPAPSLCPSPPLSTESPSSPCSTSTLLSLPCQASSQGHPDRPSTITALPGSTAYPPSALQLPASILLSVRRLSTWAKCIRRQFQFPASEPFVLSYLHPRTTTATFMAAPLHKVLPVVPHGLQTHGVSDELHSADLQK
jgi:hypothetical protein